jgi:hypothetical protein
MSPKMMIVAGALCGLFAAGAVQAKPVEHIVFHDDTGIVEYDNSTPIDCGGGVSSELFSHITINGFQTMNKNNETGVNHSNTMIPVIFQSNGCTGSFVFGAGQLDGGYTQQALQTGTFSGTVTIIDFFTGLSDGTATVNMTLTGSGPVSTGNQHFRFSVSSPNGPLIETVHDNNKSINATVTGTLTFNGAPIPLPTPDLIFSQMGVSKSGSMELDTK